MREPGRQSRGSAYAMVLLCLSCAGLAPLPARAETPVATVTEVGGYSETRARDATVQVAPLTELFAGSRVRLKQDAQLTVLFYATGDIYVLSGPALVRFTDSEVQALNGKDPQRLPAVTGRDGKRLVVRPAGLTQAGVVTRGIGKPIAEVRPAGEITLDSRPVFVWKEPEAGLSYRFVLRDHGDRLVARADVPGTSYELPPAVTLSPGQRYRWSVSTKSADGTIYLLERPLRVADEALRADVANFRPQQDASVTERIAFALWLEQAGLADEARARWKELADQGVAVPAVRWTEP